MATKGLEYLLSDQKRNLDVVGGLALATAMLPAAVAVAGLSVADTRTLNPLIAQRRVGGHSGSEFIARKFRTLRKDLTEGEYCSFGTFDPRATWLGSLIRRSGLDESPQLASVIGGSMSLIGPRPITEEDLGQNEAADASLFAEWYDCFRTVKTGLIGQSQIYRHHYHRMSPAILKTSMRMDLDYFQTASMRQDIKWLLQAPGHMLKANVDVVEETIHVVGEYHVSGLELVDPQTATSEA